MANVFERRASGDSLQYRRPAVARQTPARLGSGLLLAVGRDSRPVTTDGKRRDGSPVLRESVH